MTGPRPLLPSWRSADVLIAVAVGLVTVLIDTLGPDFRSTDAVVVDLVLAAPLVFRRRAPALAAAAIAAFCLVQWSTGVLASGDVAVLVMLYSIGAWDRRRWLLVAAIVVAEIGVVLAVARWAPPSHAWVSALMVTGTVTASWVLGVYVRTRRAYLTSMIERAETAERDRDLQATIAVDAERARMAREMHDIIAHSLSVMITLNDAAAAVAESTDVRRTVTRASDVGRQALGEMQRMLGVLRRDDPPALQPQPGSAQLAELVATVRSAGLGVELSVTGTLGDLAPGPQLVVYRIVQESLTNVLKHGRNVRRVTVGITHRDDLVTVRVHNDGDRVLTDPTARAGHGLAGMRERAALYQGRFTAAPGADGGWLVVAELVVAGASSEPAVAR